MLRRDWPPRASDIADLSEASTLKASAMICVATEMDSASSGGRVPSVVDLSR